MKKSFIFIIISIFIFTAGINHNLFAQQAVLELDGVHGPGEEFARDAVILKPGFNATVTSSQTFRAYLNENLIIPVTYSPDGTTTFNRILDNTLTPGTLPGGYNVALNGGSTYSFPIDVPPGTAGLQPSLSIGYNSQGGNGMMGIGFGLSGLSVISRCGSNMFNDGKVLGVGFNAEDKFILDGQRLILATGTYGATGAEYRTEIESFTKVFSHGTAGIGPEYFIVYGRDGSVCEYGRTTDSRIEKQGSSPQNDVINWLCNKITDINGNYITISYIENQQTGEWRPKEIQYTGNVAAGIEPYNSVKFFYSDNRQDNNTLFVGGSKIEQSMLLTTIRTYAEGSLVKEYNFNYSFDKYSHLSEVKTSAQGEEINSTVFKWGEDILAPAISYSYNDLTDFLVGNSQLDCGDVNGDGLTDIVIFDYNSILEDYTIHWKLFLATQDAGTGIIQYALTKDSPIGHGSTNSTWFCMLADVTGDGIVEMLDCHSGVIHIDIFDQTDFSLKTGNTYVTGDPNNFVIDFSHVVGSNGIVKRGDAMPAAFQVGDFNGDGRPDILTRRMHMYGQQSLFYEWEIFGYINGTEPENFVKWHITTNPSPLYDKEKAFAADFNGDGKTEILCENAIYEWNQALNTFVLMSTITAPFNLNNFDLKYIKSADFNGDGISDLLHKTIDPNNSGDIQWYVDVFDGEANFITSEIIDIQHEIGLFSNLDDYQDYVDCVDLNGDGKTDISLREYDEDGGGYSVPTPEYKLSKVIYSKGFNAWETQIFNTQLGSPLIELKDLADNGTFAFFDVEDNHVDYYDGLEVISFKPGDRSQFVTEIKNGFDVYVKTDYSTTINPDYYSSTTTAAFPFVNINSPMYVVTGVQLDNGPEYPTDDYEYFYTNAQAHLQGKGFMGFGTVTTKSLTQATKQVTTFNRINNKPFPLVASQQTLDFDDNILDKTENISNIKNYGNRYFPFISKSTTINNITGTSSITMIEPLTAQPDVDGNIGQTKTEIYNGSSMEWSSTSNNTYYKIETLPNGGWILGLPLSITSSTHNLANTAPNDAVCERRTDYVYNGFRLQQQIVEPDASDPTITSVTDFEYYPTTGMLKKTSVTADVDGNPNTRFSSVEYDTKFRFITKTINQKGHTNTFSFEPKYGNVKNATDANGNSSYYHYNAWGRLTKTINPLGVETTQTMQFAGTGGHVPAGAQVEYITSQTGVSPVFSYTDHLGRGIRAVALNVEGNEVWVDKTYNSKGNLAASSLPYFSGSAKQETFYTYEDITNRPSTVVGPTTNITYDYSGSTVTVTDNVMSVSTQKTMDAAGNIITANDPGGDITYQYYSSGLPGKITDAAGKSIIIQYDLLGRKTMLNDPDAGITNYTYTGFGELAKETDARGNVTDRSYDVLGRTVKLQESEGITEYYYDTENHGLGMPASLTRKDIHDAVYYSESYNYDYFGRPSRIQKNVKNPLDNVIDAYIVQYSYDNLGRMQNYTYPSGYSINYEYSTVTGEPIRIKNGINMIWQLDHENAMGQITNFSCGNGLGTVRTYDATTHLLTSINTGSGNVQNLLYNYNPKFQLESRTDNRHQQITESFTYDDLNRLRDISGPAGNTLSVLYEDNGNISSKTDIGTYIYDDTRIHAVKFISPAIEELVNPVNPLPDQTDASYTSFNKISQISENNHILNFTYGPDHQRLISDLDVTAQSGKRKFFLGDYEIEENLTDNSRKEWHYISAPTGTVAVAEKIDGGTATLHYIYTDHMGSVNVITNASGIIEQECSFDAWGRQRDPITWIPYSYGNEPSLMFDRGYTGHEHLLEFGLINMNGRCYDPRLARMLSPDPFVQAGTCTQSYNRYSYAFNNPLAFTDPSGYISIGGGYNAMADHWIDHSAYNDYLDNLYARGSYIYTGGQNLVHFTYGGVGGGSCVVSDGDFYSDNYSNDCYFSTSATVYQKQGSLIGSRGQIYPLYAHHLPRNILDRYVEKYNDYVKKNGLEGINKGKVGHYLTADWGQTTPQKLGEKVTINGIGNCNTYSSVTKFSKYAIYSMLMNPTEMEKTFFHEFVHAFDLYKGLEDYIYRFLSEGKLDEFSNNNIGNAWTDISEMRAYYYEDCAFSDHIHLNTDISNFKYDYSANLASSTHFWFLFNNDNLPSNLLH